MQVSTCEFSEIFKKTFFKRTSPVAASQRAFKIRALFAKKADTFQI